MIIKGTYIKIYQTITSLYSKKDLFVDNKKKQIFYYSEKTKNSGNCMFDNAHSFFEEDF